MSDIATFENTKPGDVLVSTGWEVEVLYVNERGFLRSGIEHHGEKFVTWVGAWGYGWRHKPAAPPVPTHRPPSIYDGSVSEDLVRDLNRLVGEYGHAGVQSTLTEMSSGGLLTHMGTDALRWARQFCSMHGGDESLMLGWFANAIEAGKDHQRRIEFARANPQEDVMADANFELADVDIPDRFFNIYSDCWGQAQASYSRAIKSRPSAAIATLRIYGTVNDPQIETVWTKS